MANNSGSGGVYILINGDATPLQRKLDELRGKVSKTAKQMETEMQNVFGRDDITKFATDAIGSFARIRTSIRAIGTDLTSHQREWEKYGKEIGLADAQAKKLAQTISSSLQQNSIKQVEASLRSLQRQTGMTTSEMMKLANQMGAVEIAAKKAFSDLGIKSTKQVQNEVKNLVSAYIELKKSGVASSQDIARAQTALRQRVKELKDELKGVQPVANSAYSHLVKIGTAAVSITALVSSVKTLIDAMITLDSLKVSYASIFGGDAEGSAQLSRIYDITQKLGLEFNSAAASAKGFFAASKGTSLEKDMNRIFEGVSEAAAAMHLSKEEVDGIFLALSQMVSKGKISMEEMRRQLGDRLPGAFKLAADAMGKTTQEFEKMITDGKLTAEELLPKMADAFHNKWGAAALEASKSVQSALNRLTADWTLFKANFLNSDAVKAGIEGIHSGLKALESVVKTLSNNKEIIAAVLTGAGTTAGLAMLAKYSTSIGALGTSLVALTSQAKNAAVALGSFLVANPWVAVAAAIGTASAALVYFSEKANAAEQAQKALTSAQEAAISINKLLADQGRATLEQSEAELRSAQEQYQALVAQNENLLKSLSDSVHKEFVPSFGEARRVTDEFTEKLEELALQTARTGDFSVLEKGIRSIEAQAVAAGKETNTFKQYVEQLKAVCSTGVKLHVEMTGYQNVISKLINLVRAKMQLGDTFDPSQKERENDALRGQLNGIQGKWALTKPGKISTNKDLIAQYKSLQTVLSNPDKLRELGISAEEASQKLSMLGDLIKDAQDRNEGLLKSLNKTGSSTSKAANAQTDYAKEVSVTRDNIKALQKQLSLDKTDDYGKAKIEIEKEYNKKIKETNASIEKRVRSKGITASQGEELRVLKQEEASLEMQVKLIDAKNKATEKTLSHLQEQLSFYNELAQISGNYATSMQLQNQIIDIQAQKYRDLKTIPEGMIEEWTKWKKLQASTDPFDGAYRGLLKFKAEFGDSAKQWESLTYNFAKNFESTTHQMFDDFLETGELSFDSLGKLFKQLLKDMAYYALVQPVVLSVVNGATGFSTTAGTTGAGLQGAAQSVTGQFTNLAGGLAQNYVLSKVGGSVLNYAGGTLNSVAASLFPSIYAASAASASVNSVSNAINGAFGSGATNLPTQTATGVLSGIGTMGAGLAGGLIGNYLLVPALGIKEGTGTSIGSTIGGGVGALGGALYGATLGSWGGPIGAGLGALVGTVLGAFGGSLFGGGDEDPELWISGNVNLGKAVKALSQGKSLAEGNARNTKYNREKDGIVYARWFKDNGYSRSVAQNTRDYVGQALEQVSQQAYQVSQVLEGIGDKKLSSSFAKALTKYGDIQIQEYWESSTPDTEKLAEKISEKYQKALFTSLANTNYDSLIRNEKGNIAKTTDEIAAAITKAVTVINLGSDLEEEAKAKFEEAIEVPLTKALNKVDASKIGLKVGKSGVDSKGNAISTLADWGIVAQAMQQMESVKTSIEEMLNPTSELTQKLAAVGTQWAEWEGTLSGLGWQEKKIKEIDEQRIEYLKKIGDETMAAYEAENKYGEELKKINETFNDLYDGLKSQNVDAQYLAKIRSKQNAAIENYINEQLSAFDEKSGILASLKNINDTFTELSTGLKEQGGQAKYLTQVEAKRIEQLKSVADESMRAYEAENQFSTALTEIIDTFNDLYSGLKAANIDSKYLAQVRSKQNDAINKYIDEQMSAFDEESTIVTSIKNINDHFDDLAVAVQKAGRGVDKVNQVEAKRVDVLKKYVQSLYDSWLPQDQLSQSLQEVNRNFDDLVSTLREVGASTSYLQSVEQQRNIALQQTKSSALRATDQDLALRIIALQNGKDSEEYSTRSLLYQQENELTDLEKAIGKDTREYTTTVAVQQAEQIQAEIERLQEALQQKLQEEQQKQINSINNQIEAAKEQLDLAKEQLSTAQRIKSTFDSIYRTLRDARRNLWTGEENLTGTRYSEAYKQFNETYKKALEGDEESLQKLSSIANTTLNLAREQVVTRGEYDDAFYDITTKLRTVEQYAAKKIKEADKQIEQAQAKVDQAQVQIDTLNLEKELAAQTSVIASSASYLNMSLQDIESAIAAASKRLEEAISKISVSSGASGNLSQEEALLIAKAAQLNEKEYQGHTDWNSNNVLKEISRVGLTVEQWYNAYGKNENLGVEFDTIESELSKISSDMKAILEQKAYQMNQGNTLAKGETAGGWTIEKVLAQIQKYGMTSQQWYQKHGVKEGFTSTGDYKAVTNSISTTTEKITSAVSLASMSQQEKTLALKAALMNMGQTLNAGQKASGWTVDKVLDEIHKYNMTYEDWYAKYGRKEIDEAAKNAGYIVNGNANIADFTNSILDTQTLQVVSGLSGVKSAVSSLDLSPTINTTYTPPNVAVTYTSPNVTVNVTTQGSSSSTSTTTSGGKTTTTTSGGGSSSSTTSGGSSGGSSGGGSTSTQAQTYASLSGTAKNVLQKKAAAMNQGYLLYGKKAGGWTAEKVYDEIIKIKGNYEKWYNDNWVNEYKILSQKTTSSTKYTSDYDLLVAKAAKLNKDKHLGKTDWNAGNLKSYIESLGMTVASWYTKYGKAEGYAQGGITPVGRAFWVGEEGPELMMSPQSYGVLNTRDSIDLMRASYSAGEDDEAFWLIQETNRILRQTLRKIDQLEYDTHKNKMLLQKWDQDGLPATAII